MQLDLWERDNDNGYASMIKHSIGRDTDATSAPPPHLFKPYRKILQKTDVWMTGSTVGKAADVSAGYDIILVTD